MKKNIIIVAVILLIFCAMIFALFTGHCYGAIKISVAGFIFTAIVRIFFLEDKKQEKTSTPEQ
jgi:hypothetical protein